MDHQPDVREHRSADHEIAQTQRRQRQQTELALRGNHEATRRPDRPIRQRIEPAAGSPPATTEAPRAKDHRNERNRPAPDVPNRAVLKRGGADNGSRRVHQ